VLSNDYKEWARGKQKLVKEFGVTFLCVCIAGLFACWNKGPEERVLFDFESDEELNRFHWRCHTLLSLSDEHVTHGKKSLRLELYPSEYPGLYPKLKEIDWSPYRAICFDIFNPQNVETLIAVRIDDQKDYPDYEDRYNNGFVLKPGLNRLSIPLNTLLTSGTKRNLDLKEIFRLLIFSVKPKDKVVLYVDHLRLIS
jgi:hypothetical protein